MADNLIASVDASAENAAAFFRVGRDETKVSLGVLSWICSSSWFNHTIRDLPTQVEAILVFNSIAAASLVLQRNHV